jgi:hypothetical protein
MNLSSDFDKKVEQVSEMLEQLDTESIEVHEIEEKGSQGDPEDQDRSTGEQKKDERRERKSDPTNDEDNDSGSSASEQGYQPHQYIIRAETSVGPDYVIRAVEELAYFDVIADYSLIPDIADFYETDDLETIALSDIDSDHPIFLDYSRESLEKMEEEVGEEPINRLYTAFESLDNLDEKIKADIIYQLTEIFTTAPVKYVVESTQENGQGGIKGFQVFYRIFPYEDRFSLADLNNVIEQVRMATQRGEIFLKYSFQLDIDFGEETGGSSVEANPPQQSSQFSIE